MSKENSKKYDLIDRTSQFGSNVILFAKSINNDAINKPLISQIVRSSTSIGANYMEADGAESKKDFQHKLCICKKESKETIHWLKMLEVSNPTKSVIIKPLIQEAHELSLIFSSIINKLKSSI